MCAYVISVARELNSEVHGGLAEQAIAFHDLFLYRMNFRQVVDDINLALPFPRLCNHQPLREQTPTASTNNQLQK